ncbi:TMEM165/GDT1 family protein [Piscinibacter sp. XHJ-5]|uniref:TMEM165/GDT1 family protein n=1 Tax=Piscinibacter sp. XHJ-5 TaxID=3037797 RepID=UPI002452FAFE|nr:TMEM165/GDT1 family protein [Piscinibacter sp. XHJ-5]
MHTFLIATGLVGLAEIGDKTQLLALVLAARFRKPWPIVAGILAATLINHALASALGAWLVSVTGPQLMRWILGIGFIAMALWTLVPDRFDEDDAPPRSSRGVFVTTLVAFFIAEMGDKTQIATVALAAREQAMWGVVAGTTLGMMIANVPAVLLGDRLSGRLPIAWMHRGAALVFALLGVATLLYS